MDAEASILVVPNTYFLLLNGNQRPGNDSRCSFMSEACHDFSCLPRTLLAGSLIDLHLFYAVQTM